MVGSFQNEFSHTELDSKLLSTPFGVQTKWHVITGASCSGKTTMIDQLSNKGFRTFPEVGRLYFERELAKGRTIDEIREDRAAITCQMYDMMVKREHGLGADEVAFFDRALPDGSF